jgi:hypothetical protein
MVTTTPEGETGRVVHRFMNNGVRDWKALVAGKAESLLWTGGRMVDTIRSANPIESRRWRLGRLLDRCGRGLRLHGASLEPGESKSLLWPRSSDHPAAHWTYHDEHWVRVVHRWAHRKVLSEGRALVVEDDIQQPSGNVKVSSTSISANVAADGSERWVYLYIDPRQNMWRNFRWRMTLRRDSEFRELQLGFRYIDFYNRYRFRHEDSRLIFDIVHEGACYNGIHETPFPMVLGRDYRFEIEARENRFLLSVDGVQLLDEVDPLGLFPRGSVAVILWQDDRQTAIRALFNNMEVVET